jgi:fluoroacetyl-CoA thioesterase
MALMMAWAAWCRAVAVRAQGWAMTLEPGLEAAFGYTVTEADTAAAVGSGEVPVLATPGCSARPGRAGHRGHGRRPPGGRDDHGRVRVELDHLAPSPVGADLEVEAVLERITGRRLEFAVRLPGGGRLVASGHITRVMVVDAAAFLHHAGAEAGVAR